MAKRPCKLVLPLEDLDADTIREIMVRLPVKSLLRFKCVSNEWNTLIRQPDFIACHLNRAISESKEEKGHVFIFQDRIGKFYCIKYFEGSSADEGRVVIREPRWRPGFLRVRSCCDGLLLLTLQAPRRPTSALVWNPAISEFIDIPAPPSAHNPTAIWGMGYDALGHDYKVVRAPSEYKDPSRQAEVFSLKTKVWKTIDYPGGCWYYISMKKPVTANRNPHWIASIWGRDDRVVLCFDASEEKFVEVCTPAEAKSDCVRNFGIIHIFSVKGCLGMSTCSKWKVSIWLMKEYGVHESWEKLYTIQIQPWNRIYVLHRPVGITESGSVLFNHPEEVLGLYDVEGEFARNTFDRGEISLGGEVELIPYFQSLVSPKFAN
ncbi:hypothetical protein Tsubulata_041186 [Turnera subulata]|uniref:F-box domain-containing protein n=1 Tax=Turnera subulata TaxID=218843 RepID=A0A9Q0J9G1_9ROSI|nr:hypothetical protein Tsubulata_041186 [Turnera subulata]